MMLFVTVLSFCLLSVVSFAQKSTPDSLEILTDDQKPSGIHSPKIDSLLTSFFHGADSLKQQCHQNFFTIDSTTHRLKSTLDTINSIQVSLRNSLSINSLDSMQVEWQRRVDSLTLVNEYYDKVSNVLDSLNKLKEKTLSELNTKLQSLKDKTMGKLADLDLPPQLSDKLGEASAKINEFQLPTSDFNIPGFTKNGLSMNGLKNLDLPSAEDLHIDEIDELQSIGGEISKIREGLGEYGDELKEFINGDPGGTNAIQDLAESKAQELSGLSEIKDQTKILEEYKELTEKIKNPDSLKEFAIEQAREIAVDYFSGKEDQLNQAMQTLAKYKSKYPNLNSINEVTRRPPNEMKGKPLIERMVPGVALQIQKKGEDLMMDFNPYATYKFTGRISAGLGWNQRVAYNFDTKKFNPMARIYGPRLFGELKIGKGFSPRAEIEVMNTSIPSLTRTHTTDPFHREWIWGAFAGIKKEYKLIKNVNGTASVMMRLYNPNRKSPYTDVVNARFGFEFPVKKKSPKPAQ